eukprot:TRINITY_DN55180_c0_g1_i1.p1 TRINITY_DN55180_c0_g1~~TRINITY_DN55180_c0_g1_i1.p1  ORF type:complete len:108 (-),score=18.41 TRINITY_DN55180_c0_g1_i1:294-617(-)
MATLEHVRPGGGYKPNFPIYGKLFCNGEAASPVYQFLREAAPKTPDVTHCYVCNCAPKSLTTAPVAPGDVQWNFEKFLVGKDGKVVKRYPPITPPKDIAADIEAALK